MFEVDADQADVVGWEPLWIGDRVRGYCTSGGYSHWSDRSMALAFVPVEDMNGEIEAHIEILGDLRPARRIMTPDFDPDGVRLRG